MWLASRFPCLGSVAGCSRMRSGRCSNRCSRRAARMPGLRRGTCVAPSAPSSGATTTVPNGGRCLPGTGPGGWPHRPSSDGRLADAHGRATAFVLAPGHPHELPHAVPLLDRLPRVPGWVVADRGCTSHAFREHTRDLGAQPARPTQRHEAPVACPDWIHVHRNQVERLWARLKEWRAVATRYKKTACSSMGVPCLKTALDWIRDQQATGPGRFTLDPLHQMAGPSS